MIPLPRVEPDELLNYSSSGVFYRSARRPGGECIACFCPASDGMPLPGHYYKLSRTGDQIVGMTAAKVTVSAHASAARMRSIDFELLLSEYRDRIPE